MILNDLSTTDLVLLQLHLGGDRNFSYVFGDRASREAAIVDPGFGPDELVAQVEDEGLELRHVLITHGHSDHVNGLARVVELTGAAVHAGADKLVVRARVPAAAGEILRLGHRPLVALPTAGHAPDHVCWLYEGFMATGDLLFCGKVGGTGDYFPGSSARDEWDSLHRILELPDETVVLPGHDYYGGPGTRPYSTLGAERRENPFLLCGDFDAFQHLKDNWTEYKAEHGIH